MKNYIKLLDEHGPMTTRELAQRAGAKVSTVTVGIANAQKLGLVRPVGKVLREGRGPVILWAACQ